MVSSHDILCRVSPRLACALLVRCVASISNRKKQKECRSECRTDGQSDDPKMTVVQAQLRLVLPCSLTSPTAISALVPPFPRLHFLACRKSYVIGINLINEVEYFKPWQHCFIMDVFCSCKTRGECGKRSILGSHRAAKIWPVRRANKTCVHPRLCVALPVRHSPPFFHSEVSRPLFLRCRFALKSAIGKCNLVPHHCGVLLC